MSGAVETRRNAVSATPTSPLQDGRYLLLETLGHGGMASVFRRRARRRDRSLRQAGFRKIHRYYMTPSASEPSSFIPVNRRAIASYEQITMKLSTRGTLRSRLARAGLHPVLYPATLHLAYR